MNHLRSENFALNVVLLHETVHGLGLLHSGQVGAQDVLHQGEFIVLGVLRVDDPDLREARQARRCATPFARDDVLRPPASTRKEGGWMMPCSLMDSTISARASGARYLRGCYGSGRS